VTAPAPSLEIATHTVSAWPDCGEATIYQDLPESSGDPARAERRKKARQKARLEELGADGVAAENAARSERESVRRARTKVRRWVTRHRCDRLWTFTFRDDALPADLDAAWILIETFRRAWAAAGLPPLLLVPEWGEKNGRLHFHGACRGRIDHKRIEAMWGHGFVHYRRDMLGKRKDESARSRERRLANYLGGYLVKAGGRVSPGSPDDGGAGDPVASTRTVGHGRKRYSVPVGSHPRRTLVRGLELASAWREAERLCSGGRRMKKVWDSTETPDWCGPPMVMLQDP